jgi:hypothetical protein
VPRAARPTASAACTLRDAAWRPRSPSRRSPARPARPAHAQAPPRAARAAGVPTPSQALGLEVGADRTLADWPQITGYFARLAAASPMVRVDTLGRRPPRGGRW